MAEERRVSSQDAPAAAIMVQTENSSFNIGMVLDEKNYDLWAPLIQIHIAGRKKMGYLRGSIKAPHEDDPKYDDWFSEDQKIKSWLLSSMKPEIMKRYIRLSTSKEIWDSLKVAYFDENDEARIYSLNQKASRLRKNSRPLATYFGEQTEIFQELDHFNRVSMECENDIKMFQKSTERQRVYIFLGGLDDRFDQVRGEVLRNDPALGLQASYAYVRREADRKEAMKMEVDKSEPAAMAAKTRGSFSGLNRGGSQNRSGQTQPSQPSWDRSQGKCPHCGLPGHSKSRCFEMIGYPENWDKTYDPRCNKSRASIAETRTDSDQIADKASAMLAATGRDGKALSTSTFVMNNTWIIDSGATEHMTCDSRQVPSLKTSAQTEVNVANGNVIPVIREGTVSLTDTMKLDTVLVVPSLNYNLLSVAQNTPYLTLFGYFLALFLCF
jgi:hypothetical protein